MRYSIRDKIYHKENSVLTFISQKYLKKISLVIKEDYVTVLKSAYFSSTTTPCTHVVV